jgi:acetyl esterase/lipase
MANQTNPSPDPYALLEISLNPDGSLTRHNPSPTLPTTTQSKDITLNAANQTFIRLFRPLNPPSTTKLPLILYFHGSGFIVGSATSPIFHHPCSTIASQIPALIASVQYRLAPEHRLPSAYDDAVDAITWARNQANRIDGRDPWMETLADFSKVFLMGCSAGGNIAYHAALRALALDLSPIKIIGLIMNQPFFSGSDRSESELRLVHDRILPLSVNDLMWSLGLPKGATKDHEYCNPLISVRNNEEKIGRLPRCLMWANLGDPLVDREKQLSELLKGCGVEVVEKFNDGGCHGLDIFEPTTAQFLYDHVKEFVYSTITPSTI